MLGIALNAIPSSGFIKVVHIAIGFLEGKEGRKPELTEKRVSFLTLGYKGRLEGELLK